MVEILSWASSALFIQEIRFLDKIAETLNQMTCESIVSLVRYVNQHKSRHHQHMMIVYSTSLYWRLIVFIYNLEILKLEAIKLNIKSRTAYSRFNFRFVFSVHTINESMAKICKMMDLTFSSALYIRFINTVLSSLPRLRRNALRKIRIHSLFQVKFIFIAWHLKY